MCPRSGTPMTLHFAKKQRIVGCISKLNPDHDRLQTIVISVVVIAKDGPWPINDRRFLFRAMTK